MLNTLDECCGDIQKMHRDFHFQHLPVDGSWTEKIQQYVTQVIQNRGIPDELTFVLGSFSIYVAIGNVFFYKRQHGTLATITDVNFYVKDRFSFSDRDLSPPSQSQYLGHWNQDGVSIVPVAQITALAGLGGCEKSPLFSQTLLAERSFIHPLRNTDFREWQMLHKQGGDYSIHTDVISKYLHSPLSIMIPYVRNAS